MLEIANMREKYLAISFPPSVQTEMNDESWKMREGRSVKDKRKTE
jgi:hypothetical protein